jgi:hypothetical protein
MAFGVGWTRMQQPDIGWAEIQLDEIESLRLDQRRVDGTNGDGDTITDLDIHTDIHTDRHST